MAIMKSISRIKKEIGKAELVAVTKTRDIEDIKEAVEHGVKVIGENRVQEAESKYDELKDYFKKNKVEFHLIGHLQSNKVKKAVRMFDVIQSVDSIKLAELIDNMAGNMKKVQRIFIEVNIGEEPHKSGIAPVEAMNLIGDMKNLKNLKVEGMMCIPPYSETPEDSRSYFREMKRIFDKSKLRYLSMGMTNDYKIAIEEGSNMIRIGRGIFGERIK